MIIEFSQPVQSDLGTRTDKSKCQHTESQGEHVFVFHFAFNASQLTFNKSLSYRQTASLRVYGYKVRTCNKSSIRLFSVEGIVGACCPRSAQQKVSSTASYRVLFSAACTNA